jgi:hypothetical protein
MVTSADGTSTTIVVPTSKEGADSGSGSRVVAPRNWAVDDDLVAERRHAVPHHSGYALSQGMKNSSG